MRGPKMYVTSGPSAHSLPLLQFLLLEFEQKKAEERTLSPSMLLRHKTQPCQPQRWQLYPKHQFREKKNPQVSQCEGFFIVLQFY